MDEVIFEEFKGTGNCDIVLSGALANRSIFPSIDISKSRTRKDELLIKDRANKVRISQIRRILCDDPDGTKNLINSLYKTDNNKDFLNSIDSRN